MTTPRTKPKPKAASATGSKAAAARKPVTRRASKAAGKPVTKRASKTVRKPATRRASKAASESGSSAPTAAATAAATTPGSLLTQPLGLEGWSALEPVLLAALACAEPLLLVGRHGAAKSFLLERLAEALGLSFRCYNASLIDYDDLVGIPVPNDDGKGLHYIATPTAIWGAEVVFVDEISRTRPDLANKLFPIIHERRVQGVDLESLRYRWAAMNPPASEDDDDGEDDEAYLGVEPLDPALADRFAFLIEVPDWADLTDTEQARVLVDQFRGKHPMAVDLDALLGAAQRTYELLCQDLPERLTDYFLALAKARASAGQRPFSTRRMATLLRTSLALHAARLALAHGADPDSRPAEVDWDTSVWLAVRHGDPALASAGTLDRARQLALHRQAWKLSGLDVDDPWRELLELVDPVERAVRALRLRRRLPPEDIGTLVLDALASETNEALRVATALALYLGSHRVEGLPAVTVETLARDARRALEPARRTLQVPSSKIGAAREVGRLLAGLSLEGDSRRAQRDRYTRNLLESLLPDGFSGVTPHQVSSRFRTLWTRLGLNRKTAPRS
jgi:MoxR-like ATPase